MRAVIYARYSSDLQSAASIEDQIRLCRERVEQENGTVVDIYADYAISGSSVRNRPSMQALLEQAKRASSIVSLPRLWIASVATRKILLPSISDYDIPRSASSLWLRARSANCMWASRAQ